MSKRTGRLQNFYPRPPRGGRRHRSGVSSRAYIISIHALREEGDLPRGTVQRRLHNFYPRPPRGGRHKCGFCQVRKTEFLSTPSARRATTPDMSLWMPLNYFYPRPPRGGRRPASAAHWHPQGISIHALREEGDWCLLLRCQDSANFYPRPPRGGRHHRPHPRP